MEIEKMKDCLTAWDIDYGIPVADSNFYLSWENSRLIEVCQQYGKKYHIRPAIGVNTLVSELTHQQMVINGDSKTYHFILTKKIGAIE